MRSFQHHPLDRTSHASRPGGGFRRSRSDRQLFELVRLAYAAATRTDGWKTFLDRYREVMSGASVAFVFWDRITRHSSTTMIVGLGSGDIARDYNTYYGKLNPLMRNGSEYMRPGIVAPSQARFPLDEFLRTE